MDRTNLQEQLIDHHITFGQCLYDLSESDFLKVQQEKWSAGQQLEHILMSVKPLSRLLGNKTEVKERFGSLDRESRSYDVLVADYLQVLSEGAKAGPRFTPEVTPFQRRAALISELNQHIESITTHLDHYTEEELDQLVIPHPVMGPFTIREMMMFTIYHVQHHLKKVEENLKNWSGTN